MEQPSKEMLSINIVRWLHHSRYNTTLYSVVIVLEAIEINKTKHTHKHWYL